jgi:hypothetical protein
MFPGTVDMEKRNWEISVYDHAHIDHTGLLSLMTQK